MLDCGIIDEIRNAKANVDAATLTNYRTMLEGKYGYSPRLCNAAIMQWVNDFKEDDAVKQSASNDLLHTNSIDIAINRETAQMAPIHEHNKHHDT